MKNKIIISVLVFLFLLSFVYAGQGAFYISNKSATSQTYFFVNGTTGRVGIGTTAPQSTLNVLGDINVTGGTYGLIPTGMVSAFDLSSCPTGWTLADGNGGTPNLVGKFILANTTRGQTGGSTTIT